MSSTYVTDALILRRKPYREADRMIVVLTPERGKLELIARGAAKIRSKMAANLEPFLHVQLLVARGKTFDTIAASTTYHRSAGLAQSLVRRAWAEYTIELLVRVIQARQSDPMLFDLTRSTWNQFERLSVIKKKEYRRGFLVLAAYVLKLMSRIGYQPGLYRCATCQGRLQPDGNAYYFSHGGLICRQCQIQRTLPGSRLVLSGAAIRLLRFSLRQPYTAIRRVTLTDEQLKEVKAFADKLVAYQTEFVPRSQRFLSLLLRKKTAV